MEIEHAPTQQLGRFVALLKRIAGCLEGRREGDLTATERQAAELLVADGFLVRDASRLLRAGGE